MIKKIGKDTVKFENPPRIAGNFSIVGEKEGNGPLAKWFDKVTTDAHFGEDSWEKAEMRMLLTALKGAIINGSYKNEEIDCFFGGDLLNQCISANFALRELGIPFFGIYGACSTMVEGLILGSMVIDGGFYENVLCGASSHFCSAERQYRFPLNYGGQRTPTAQWTVTGAGATVLSSQKGKVKVTHATVGRVVDIGIKDANNMGAAMAPAAYQTISSFFEDTGYNPQDYDRIFTGDLGNIGHELLKNLLIDNKINVLKNLDDCGCMIFSEEQDVHAGGSGCGCCGSVLNSYIIKKLEAREYKKVLVAATGALMSPTTAFQGETIPGISHLIQLEAED